MIDQRLIPYLDLSKHFLEVTTINECLLEFQSTQKNIFDVIRLKGELDTELRSHSRKYHTFMSERRDATYLHFRKSGICPTEKNIEDYVIRAAKVEYEQLKEKIDECEINSEIAKNILMALYQRKDIIAETIKFFQCKKENENCMAKNKEFLRKLGVLIDGTTNILQRDTKS